ncbi:Bug family tripartite tricarboxylate transporter substrate binding protein [Histidinibacterium lentulum]|nr:tripartite tricarboxylate transporter substrate-binding protein [Histidinibacterium lentulum]
MKHLNALAMSALLSSTLAATSAIAQEALAPLDDGFPNRPIILLVIDSPGSADSLFAGQIAEAASRFSPQPVVVEHREDFTNFGTWEGIAWIKDQGELASEGYITYVLTVPDAQVDMAALDIESMTGQTMADLNPVISAERVPYFLIQRADAPWGDTIEDLIAYAQENPGAVRHVTGGPGGGQDAAMRFWASALNIPMTDVIGGNPQERALAVASGEGDITASPPDVLGPHYDAGRVNLLLGAGGTTFPEPWQDVPPSETLFDGSDPFSQTRTIATSPDVPDAHRDWLYQLFSTAAQDPDYVARREQVTALEVIDLDPAESMALAEFGLETSIQIFKDLGIYWADQ